MDKDIGITSESKSIALKVDEECRQMFKDDLDAAGRGEREHWKADRDGNLAFILLNDQMSRNIYRGTA